MMCWITSISGCGMRSASTASAALRFSSTHIAALPLCPTSCPPELLDDDLEVVLVVLDAGANAEEPAVGDGEEDVARRVPHPRRDGRTAVGDERLHILLAVAARGQLLVGDDVNVFDQIAGLAVT